MRYVYFAIHQSIRFSGFVLLKPQWNHQIGKQQRDSNLSYQIFSQQYICKGVILA